MFGLTQTKSVELPSVEPMSPADLLAKSLTDQETRDEWKREFRVVGYSAGTIYKNETRDISITRHFNYGSGGVTTPFTLSKAGEAHVLEALEAFDKRQTDERQKAALARLIAPKAKAKPYTIKAKV